MSVYRREGSAYWWIDIYRGDGKPRLRRSSGTTDQTEANAIESAMLLAVKGNASKERVQSLLSALFPEEPSHTSGLAISSAWDLFSSLPEVELSSETRRKMHTNWHRFVRWIVQEWPSIETLDQITEACAFAFADYIRDAVPKRKTYNNIKGDIRTVLERLRYRAGLKENPFRHVPHLRTTDSISGRAFTDQEQARILETVAGTEWEGVCLMALYTGLRGGDVATLRWQDIAGGTVRLIPAKTARHRIAVAIPLHRRVRDWLDRQPHTSPYLFPTRQARHGQTNYADDFSNILRAASVFPTAGEYLSFHCWRHTFRTNLSRVGVDKATAQRLGGWTTDISEDIYNHDLDTLAEAIQALP